jgi:hypothetical protein
MTTVPIVPAASSALLGWRRGWTARTVFRGLIQDPTMATTERRVRLTDCRLEKARGRLQAQIALAEGQQSVQGTADRPDGPDAGMWCSAEATVAALRQLAGLDSATLELKDVVTLEISDGPGIAVALYATVDGSRRRLFGLAQAEKDRACSAAKAVLAATNRFLGSV